MGQALLLATSARLPYRVLRCAHDCFEAVFVFGSSEARLLRFSVACAGFTPANVHEGDFASVPVESVNRACRQLRIDTVLPGDGETTRWLGVHGHLLDAHCFPVPEADVFDTLDDKHAFALFCHELDIPVPPMVLMENAAQVGEAVRRGTLNLPAIVKPLRLWGSLGVAKFDRDNAETALAGIDYAPVLVQGYIPGRDLSAFFVCHSGKVRAEVIYELTPERVHFIRHDAIVELARRMITRFAYNGVVGFDIRERPDGALFFLECNPRFGYRMDATRRAGLNFVALGRSEGADDTVLGLDDTWIPRPRSLYVNPLWMLDESMRGLALELMSDVAVNVGFLAEKGFRFRRHAHGKSM